MKAIVIICTVALLFAAQKTIAQQQVQFSQYMYNPMSINPAYAGTNGKLEALIMHRSQWVGLSGAPSTQNLGVNGGIGKVIGLGFNVVNDRIGPANQTYITGAVSARIRLSDKVNLSLGINGGMDILNVDWSKGQIQSENDPMLTNNIRNRVRPLIGSGLFLYANNWYVGVSSPSFIQRDLYGREEEAAVNSNIHGYLTAGYVFSVGDNLKLKPAILAKVVKGAPMTFDFSFNTLIKEKITAGLAYRYHDAMTLLLGYTFKKSYFFGYSYDMSITKLRNYNYGSHDIIFKYNLFNKEMAARSPRFF